MSGVFRFSAEGRFLCAEAIMGPPYGYSITLKILNQALKSFFLHFFSKIFIFFMKNDIISLYE